MACYLPFKNRNLDLLFYSFTPTVAVVDEVVGELKQFSLYTENFGCMHSAVLKSIHGNMVTWYGAWIKRSSQSRDSLNETLFSWLAKMSSAILIDHNYFDAYGGESKDGSPAARFCTGDIVSLSSTIQHPTATPSSDDTSSTTTTTTTDFSYACLAIFKSNFQKMEGVIAGVCLKSQIKPRVINVYVWKQLQSCYSWILNFDYRRTVLPYIDGLNLNVKYDIFKVVYASGDNVLLVNHHHHIYPPHRMLENDRQVENKGSPQVVQD